MKKLILLGVALLVLALPCMAGESELTGVLKKTVKSHSPYKLELDGATGSFYLRGDVLKDVPERTRIWVKGEIKTELYDSSVIEGISVWPTHWQIFMEVKKYKKINKAFERPKAVDAHEDVLLPKLVCPDKTRVGELTTFIVSATDPDSKALQYQLRVSKQSGRVWTFDVGREPASGKPCTYRNNFSVWGAGTFHVQARVSDGMTWSPWSEPRTIVCDD